MEQDWRRTLLGRNIQLIRLEKHMKQKEVVEALRKKGISMSRRMFSNIETGRKNVSVSELRGLKEIFDISYDEFFRE